MRIALYDNLTSGGAKRVAYEHCRELVKAGHEVIAYEPETADKCFLDLGTVATELHRLPFVWRRSILHRFGSYRRLTALQQRLARQIDADGFDLVYVHHDSFETAPSLLRFLKTPSVYFCQEPSRRTFEAPLLIEEVEPEAVIRQAGALWLKALIGSPMTDVHVRYRLLNERINTLAATVLLANSDYSCESILRAHGRVARKLTLGVNTDFFSPDDTPREDFVLSVGGVSPRKGYRFIIRSLALLPPALRPPLVIAGDRVIGGEADVLRDLAGRLDVKLTMHERLDHDKVRELYCRARLFLFAPYLEPLGLAPLEAMACGCPVLGVREGGLRETVTPAVGRLAVRDERQFAGALTELLGDPPLLQQLGGAARPYIMENWTWQRSVEELLEVFNGVVAP